MHLPQEGKRFTNVDRQWRKTLDKVQAAPQIITFCDNEELKEQWIKSNAELERVQKNLADYLETKRTAFARFYFLSNDELISILSQTKDPNAVQPHLRKCFEAVHAITMQVRVRVRARVRVRVRVSPNPTPNQVDAKYQVCMTLAEPLMCSRSWRLAS